MAKNKTSPEPKKVHKKGWFKKFLERMAKANEESGGRPCLT